MITLEALNALPASEFIATLGGVFEHSPWVPERVAAMRPFATRAQLLEAMRAAVQAATPEEQLRLIRAHPQLAARGRNRLELTAASAREQQRAGLDAVTSAVLTQIEQLNAAYLEKFDFPFIIAVRGHDSASILENCRRRLANEEPQERRTALRQIELIAEYRLNDLVG
ncbi:MAG: 2-oxo-4-hydroxy-4-carboxy-5-ureidoimidazoline decarboxylase [Steroidobacteraceae bacterium]|jgi:OHCU decarboxylase